MVAIHDSVARIYEHDRPRRVGRDRARRGDAPAVSVRPTQALCEFRAGRYRAALTAALAADDPESRYWQARAATELALAAFKRLDRSPTRAERRVVRATLARGEGRFADAIAELKAALTFAPGDPALSYELASAYYAARDYDQAVATLAPLLQSPSRRSAAAYS